MGTTMPSLSSLFPSLPVRSKMSGIGRKGTGSSFFCYAFIPFAGLAASLVPFVRSDGVNGMNNRSAIGLISRIRPGRRLVATKGRGRPGEAKHR